MVSRRLGVGISLGVFLYNARLSRSQKYFEL
jgi:hypothetical protein